jgi:ADP-ribose pyrophosphatase
VARRVLEVPRGFLDDDEDPGRAALRELNEETGLICPRDKLLSLGIIQPEPGMHSARVALFVATPCQQSGQRLDDEIGNDEQLWISLAEARRRLTNCEMEEASTCIALHRYFLRANGEPAR